MFNIKKKNAKFGRYPSCDMLNNALRFLLEKNIENELARYLILKLNLVRCLFLKKTWYC